MPDADTLIFRVSARQRRTALLIAAGGTAAAAALTAIGLTHAGHVVTFYTLTLAASAILVAYCFVAISRAYTQCTPGALRMRGWGRRREWPWAQVTGLAIRQYPRGSKSALQITLRNGRQFWLIVPASTGLAKDPGFASNAQKIIDYWRSVAAPDQALMGRRQAYRDGPAATVYRWVAIGVLSLAYAIALPVTLVQGGMDWAAHLGAGQTGYFQADSPCSNCGWTGTFRGNDGSVSYDVSLSDASITGPGDEIPALSVAGNIYPAGGGSGWIYTTFVGLVELAILCVLIHFWRRRRRRRKAAATAPAALPGPGQVEARLPATTASEGYPTHPSPSATQAHPSPPHPSPRTTRPTPARERPGPAQFEGV